MSIAEKPSFGTTVRAALTLVLLVAATALCAHYAEGWPSDNRPSIWMAPAAEDPAFVVVREAFGGDEVVLIRVEAFGLDDAKALAWLVDLSARLRRLPAVFDVLDPFHLPGAPRGAPAEVLRAAASRPSGRALGLARVDPPRADFVVRVRADAAQTACVALAHEVRAVVDEARGRGMQAAAGGHPLVAAALDDEARRVEHVFSPLLALAAVIGITIALRSPVLAAITVMPAALASTAVRAAMRAIDWPANLILVSAGPITFVIALAATLHVVATFRRRFAAGESAGAAVRGMFREKLLAGILSGITTGIGFLAFAFSPVEPVKRLGIAVSAAVTLATLLEYGAVPLLLVGLVRRRPDVRAIGGVRWRHIAVLSMRRRTAVVLTTLAIIAGGVVAPGRLEQGTNALDYFPRGHPIRDQFLELEKAGGALTTLEVIAKRRDGAPWRAIALVGGKVDLALKEAPGALDVVGPELIAADVRHTAALAAGALMPSALKQSGRLDASGEWAHWTVRIPTVGATETCEIRDRIVRAARRSPFLADAEVQATGSIIRILEVQTHLVGTLRSSLGLTLAITIALFFLVIRSLRELIAALLANLLPVGAVLIAPWILGWQLDAATVMTASVVLGLAYNTFHLLQGAGPLPERRRLRAGLGSFHRVGSPAAVSYVVLSFGFSVLMLSGFAPTSRFGFLTALGVLFALLGDLVVLPAVWLAARRQGS